MKNNIFKMKATTFFAYLQYIGGLSILFLLIYTEIPEENEDLIKMLATALIVSALKDAGQWMYKEIDNRITYNLPVQDNCTGRL